MYPGELPVLISPSDEGEVYQGALVAPDTWRFIWMEYWAKRLIDPGDPDKFELTEDWVWSIGYYDDGRWWNSRSGLSVRVRRWVEITSPQAHNEMQAKYEALLIWARSAYTFLDTHDVAGDVDGIGIAAFLQRAPVELRKDEGTANAIFNE